MTADMGWSERVFEHAGDRPYDPSYVSADERWSLEELMGHVGGAADLVRDLSIADATPVPGLIEHLGRAISLVLGGAAVGRPYAPLGTRLTPNELTAVVRNLETGVLLAEPQHRELADEVAWGAGVRVVEVDDLPVVEPPAPAAANAVTCYLHTSGTTGVPKRVTLTEDRLAARLRSLDGVTTFGPGDIYLSAAAFHHIAGIGNIVFALGLGGAVAGFRRFSVEAWRALAPVGITHTLVVPSMIDALLEADALAAHDRLRLLVYGASPIHIDTLREAMASLPDVDFLQLFGQTEGTPLTALLPEDHVRAVAGRPDLLTSAGRAAPGVELHIHEPDSSGVGEVWAKGAHLNVVDEEGWQHTGDLGRIDAEGYLYLVGRLGDTINRSGENVRPLEVEQVLRTHPTVADVAVVGLPDRRLGEKVAAFVVLADGAEPDWDDLRAHARQQLAGFKVPEQWETLTELPRNAGGKVLRRLLIEQATR